MDDIDIIEMDSWLSFRKKYKSIKMINLEYLPCSYLLLQDYNYSRPSVIQPPLYFLIFKNVRITELFG